MAPDIRWIRICIKFNFWILDFLIVALRQLWGKPIDTYKMLWFWYRTRRQGCEEAIMEDWTCCAKRISWPPGRWR